MERVENLAGFMNNLDKNLAVQTEILKSIKEHNSKQDLRMDFQESQLREQHNTIVAINENLTELIAGQRELNEGQRKLHTRVDSLQERVDNNDDLHRIDLREVEKKKYSDILIRYVIPAGGLAVIVYEIVKAMV